MDQKNISEIKTDVVVIGSGGGMVAAITAAENGTDVIVVEKQGVLGGKTRMAFGFWACDSPVQRREGIITSRDRFFKVAMEWSHWYRVNPRVIRAFINRSGDTVRWLEEKGVKFDINSLKERVTAHVPIGSGKSLMEKLEKSAESMGVMLMLHSSGKSIVKGEKGRVKGVIVERDNKEIFIKAESVIIATGGLTGSPELLKKYCPDYYDGMYTGNWPYHTGDGIRLAQEAGAEIMDNIPIFHVGPVIGSAWGELANVVKDPYSVWVNKVGHRFIDEAGCMVWESGNAISMQPGKTMFCLFDDLIRENMERRGIFGRQSWSAGSADVYPRSLAKALIERATKTPDEVKVSDSLEEISGWIGCEYVILKRTIDEYNQACSSGYDGLLLKSKDYLIPLTRPPYYAVKGIVDCGETMGGVRVNEFMEAQDANGRTIPGLYVAGVLADGWASQTYCCREMSGSAYGFALTSGRIAGESAARYAMKAVR